MYVCATRCEPKFLYHRGKPTATYRKIFGVKIHSQTTRRKIRPTTSVASLSACAGRKTADAYRKFALPQQQQHNEKLSSSLSLTLAARRTLSRIYLPFLKRGELSGVIAAASIIRPLSGNEREERSSPEKRNSRGFHEREESSAARSWPSLASAYIGIHTHTYIMLHVYGQAGGCVFTRDVCVCV